MVVVKQEIFFNIRLFDIVSGDICAGHACHFESRNFTKLYTLFEIEFKDNFESYKHAFFLYWVKFGSQILNSNHYIHDEFLLVVY